MAKSKIITVKLHSSLKACQGFTWNLIANQEDRLRDQGRPWRCCTALPIIWITAITSGTVHGDATGNGPASQNSFIFRDYWITTHAMPILAAELDPHLIWQFKKKTWDLRKYTTKPFAMLCWHCCSCVMSFCGAYGTSCFRAGSINTHSLHPPK